LNPGWAGSPRGGGRKKGDLTRRSGGEINRKKADGPKEKKKATKESSPRRGPRSTVGTNEATASTGRQAARGRKYASIQKCRTQKGKKRPREKGKRNGFTARCAGRGYKGREERESKNTKGKDQREKKLEGVMLGKKQVRK